MIDIKKIGEHIGKLRKERGLTGEKFAELLNVSPQAVSKWETGKNLPETTLLPNISKILNVSIDSLLIPVKYPVKLHLGGYYIDGIPQLHQTQSQGCTWAGSIKVLLDAIGINISYPEIMGFSGTCYYFCMTPNWCPSAMMPQIEYHPNIVLEQVVGVEQGSFVSEERDIEVKKAIKLGMPVMLIEPRIEMEWGVLCGYTEDGRFYGRSYFDNLKPEEKDIFTDNNYFLADKYPGADPGLIYFIKERTVPLPLNEALKLSLETAKNLYMAKPRHNGHYVFGLAAYDILISSLRFNDADFAAISQYGTTGNGIILLTRLIDTRRAAYAFWVDKAQYLSAANARKMHDVSEHYNNIVSALGTVLSDKLIASTQNGFPFEAWVKETRKNIADILVKCRQLEEQALNGINDVLNHW